MFELTGKVALVTGAVVVNDFHGSRAGRGADRINAAGGSFDVTDLAAVRRGSPMPLSSSG